MSDYNKETEEVDLFDLPEMSPKMVAAKLFTNSPQDPGSCMILSYEMDAGIQFEILITILVEGFKILTNTDYKDIDLNEMTENHIEALEPWFNSLGYFIHCCEYKKKDKELKDLWENYYCKIIFNNADYGYLFELKKFDEDYHFLLGGNWKKDIKEVEDIKELHTIIENDDKVFDIYFTPLKN